MALRSIGKCIAFWTKVTCRAWKFVATRMCPRLVHPFLLLALVISAFLIVYSIRGITWNLSGVLFLRSTSPYVGFHALTSPGISIRSATAIGRKTSRVTTWSAGSQSYTSRHWRPTAKRSGARTTSTRLSGEVPRAWLRRNSMTRRWSLTVQDTTSPTSVSSGEQPVLMRVDMYGVWSILCAVLERDLLAARMENLFPWISITYQVGWKY